MSILALTSNTLVTAAAGQIEYNGQFFGTDSAASRAQLQRITQGTAVASTSGTSIDFTALPAWVKKITVMLSGVSVSSTSSILVQLGTGATPTYTITGYAGGGVRFGASTLGGASFTTGFGLNNTGAAALIGGSITITNVTGNTWSASGSAGSADTGTLVMVTGGSIALAAALTAVRITTNGADTFDAGSVNILYEG